MNTLRIVNRDPDIRFRRFALSYLSADGDSFAKGLFIDQLEQNRTDLVQTAEAMSIVSLTTLEIINPL